MHSSAEPLGHECVSFILIRGSGDGGDLLVEQRREDIQSDPGLLAIPGGHCEPSESLVQALQREMLEELNLQPLKQVYLCAMAHQSTIEKQHIHYFLIEKWQGEMQCLEAQALQWLPLNRLDSLDIVADQIAVRKALNCESGITAAQP